MTNEEAVKIIRAGGWGYPENMVTEANLMAVEALEKQTPLEPVDMDVEEYALDEPEVKRARPDKSNAE